MKSPSPSSQNTTHRHTLQRQIILDAVAECGGHCSPDGIYARVQKVAPTISRSTVVPEAQKLGKTVFQTDPTHKVAQQYRELAREIEERTGRAQAAKPTAAPSEVTSQNDELAEAVANG